MKQNETFRSYETHYSIPNRQLILIGNIVVDSTLKHQHISLIEKGSRRKRVPVYTLTDSSRIHVQTPDTTRVDSGGCKNERVRSEEWGTPPKAKNNYDF